MRHGTSPTKSLFPSASYGKGCRGRKGKAVERRHTVQRRPAKCQRPICKQESESESEGDQEWPSSYVMETEGEQCLNDITINPDADPTMAIIPLESCLTEAVDPTGERVQVTNYRELSTGNIEHWVIAHC